MALSRHKPPLLFPLSLAALLLLCGCFERESVLELNADGSGTLTVHTTVGEALMTYARNHAGVASRGDWFNKDALTRAAGNHGGGVRYLEHETAETDGGTRFTVVYGFEDIRTVRLRLDTEAPFLLTPAGNQTDDAPAFRFGGRPAEGYLEIIPPLVVERNASPRRVQVESARARAQREQRFHEDRAQLMRHGNPFGLEGDETREEVARALTRGMRFELSVLLPAQIVAGNARYLRQKEDRHLVRLFFMEAEKALAHDPIRRRAQNGELHLVGWNELSEAEGTQAERDETVRLRWRVE